MSYHSRLAATLAQRGIDPAAWQASQRPIRGYFKCAICRTGNGVYYEWNGKRYCSNHKSEINTNVKREPSR